MKFPHINITTLCQNIHLTLVRAGCGFARPKDSLWMRWDGDTDLLTKIMQAAHINLEVVNLASFTIMATVKAYEELTALITADSAYAVGDSGTHPGVYHYVVLEGGFLGRNYTGVTDKPATIASITNEDMEKVVDFFASEIRKIIGAKIPDALLPLSAKESVPEVGTQLQEVEVDPVRQDAVVAPVVDDVMSTPLGDAIESALKKVLANAEATSKQLESMIEGLESGAPQSAASLESQMDEISQLTDGVTEAFTGLETLLTDDADIPAQPTAEETLPVALVDEEAHGKGNVTVSRGLIQDLIDNMTVDCRLYVNRKAQLANHITLMFDTYKHLKNEIFDASGVSLMKILNSKLAIDISVSMFPLIEEALAAGIYEEGDVNDHYALELSHSHLIWRYQYISGSRVIVEIDPEQFFTIKAALARKIRAAVLSTFPEFVSGTEIEHKAEGSSAPVIPAVVAEDDEEVAVVKTDPVLIEMELLIAKPGKIILPEQKLQHYPKIKAIIAKAGGRYKDNAFHFDELVDTTDLLDTLQNGGKPNPKKKYQFFATPIEQVTEMLMEVGDVTGKKLMEPSAGDGRIALAARAHGADVTTVEIWDQNVAKLKKHGFEPIEGDFLTMTPDQLGMFDVILANPPFTGGKDMSHFMHMTKFLKPGGIISSYMSPTCMNNTGPLAASFRKFLQQHNAKITKIEAGAFKESGTGIETYRVTMTMPLIAETESADTSITSSVEEVQEVAAALEPAVLTEISPAAAEESQDVAAEIALPALRNEPAQPVEDGIVEIGNKQESIAVETEPATGNAYASARSNYMALAQCALFD